MKIKVITIGKSNPEFIQSGCQHYLGKLKHLCDIEWIDLISKNKYEQKEKILKLESGLFLNQIESEDHVILLDERGKSFQSSFDFSDYINRKQVSGTKRIVFLVGGSFGFDEDIYQRANEKISLATMTFSHQMIRLIFLEQLYRGYAILNHLPYHHE